MTQLFSLVFKTGEKYGNMGASFIAVHPVKQDDGSLLLVAHDCSPTELAAEVRRLKKELDGIVAASKARSAAYMIAKATTETER